MFFVLGFVAQPTASVGGFHEACGFEAQLRLARRSSISRDSMGPEVVEIIEDHDVDDFSPKKIWYPLVMTNIAMENGPFIDGLPIKNGDFPWLC